MIGFISTQFLQREIAGIIWIRLSILGATLGTILSFRTGKRIRNPAAAATAKRIGTIWLLLAVCSLAAIAVTWPLDGK